MTPTTNDLIAGARANRTTEIYPTNQMLLHNLPILLRVLCDFILTENSTRIEMARALASVIDAVENGCGGFRFTLPTLRSLSPISTNTCPIFFKSPFD